MHKLISNKIRRVFNKTCSIVLLLTFITHILPLEGLAAQSTNYRLHTFAVNSGGSGAGAEYAFKQSTFGEDVNGNLESGGIKAKTGFLHTIIKDETSSLSSGTGYLAESANFRQEAYLLGATGGATSSVNFSMPLVGVGESSGGISANYGDNIFAGYLYVIAGNFPVLTQNIPNISWPINTSNDSAFDLDDYFVDPDGDELIFSVIGNTDIIVEIDLETHQVSLSQADGWTGDEDVVITAIDPAGNRASSKAITLNVYNVGVDLNNAPVLEYIPDITVKEGQLIEIIPQSADSDGDVITYSFSAPFDSQGNWQTDYQSAGSYDIAVTASDGLLNDTQNVKVIVENLNRRPTLNYIADITGKENQLIEIVPTATDPDADALTYTFSSPFNSQGRWLPAYSDAGVYTVIVTVSDGTLTDSRDLQVTVSNVNTTPTVRISLDKINAAINEDVGFIVRLSDADDDPLTLTLQKDGTQFYSESVYGLYVGTVSFSELGVHTITAIVDDGNGGQAQTEVNVEVINPGDLWNKILPLLGDFNGDGLVDIGTYNRVTGRWAIALSSLSGFGSITEWLTGFGDSMSYYYVNGDFNGDGKTDIATFNQTNGEWQVGISDGAAFTHNWLWATFADVSYDHIPLTGDFNGDGVSDVGTYNKSNGNVTVALSNKNGFDSETVWLSSFSYSDKARSFSGDFNGDGLTDLGVFDGGTWNFAVSDGRRFILKSGWTISFGTDKTPIISDFNNDGLTDIGVFHKDSGRWQIYRCTGDGFVSADDWLNNFGQGEYNTVYALDFNGDGLTDAAAFDNSTFMWQRLPAQGRVSDLLSKITNSLNGTTELTYKSSVNYDNTGDDDKSDLPFAMQTVAKVKQGDGQGNYYQTEYFYANGLYVPEERENRGFGYVKVTDVEGNYSEHYFKQDHEFKGRPEKQFVFDSSGNLYSKTENIWYWKELYPGVIFPYLESARSYTYEAQPTPKTTKVYMEYDDYGNKTKTISYGDIDKTGDEVQVFTDYLYDTDKYIVGLPKYIKVTDASDESGITISKKWFYYDNHLNLDDMPEKGLLTKEEIWLDTVSQPLSTSYSYDEYGNPVSATDTLGRTITTQYEETFHTYPIKVTNSLGHTVESTYDFKTGQVLTSTDPNNQISRKEYDLFGRVLKVFGPNNDASHPAIWYEYDLSASPAKITTHLREEYNTDDEDKIHTSYSFIDGLGRTIQIKTQADDTAKQTVSGAVVFNSRGQVEKKYFSFLTDKTAEYTEPDFSRPYVSYAYDAMGRMIKQINPDLTYTTVEYFLRTVTGIDENGNKIKKYQDAYNRIIRIEEFNHGRTYTTKYLYDTQGNLIKTIDDHGNEVRITYDSLGRKTAMDDPDMGSWQYEYDAAGNLIKQTDAKGQTLEFEYDDINRLITKKSNSEVIVTYLYDETSKANCIGRLSKIRDQSGETEFFYDNIGREIKSSKIIEGTIYTIERTYDAIDRLKALTYPDGEILNYSYTPSGGIKSIIGSETYVSDASYTVMGQLSQITYGNSVYTDYTYNPQTLRLQHLSTNSGVLQDLHYQFDPIGNITTITDSVNTATQSFAYDDLSRLVSAIGRTYGTKTYKYDSIGNIIEKDGKIYAYGENNAGPHAVTSLRGETETIPIRYDANGNMTAKAETTYEYDIENRLTKAECPIKEAVPTTFDLTLQPGWNYFSLPLVPADGKISTIFSNLNFNTDYDQISTYNPERQDFDNYNNTAYSQFDTLEYGRGYLVYVINTNEIILTINGTYNAVVINYNLKTGWNQIGTPSHKPIKVSEALNNLIQNTDYDRIAKYNPETQTYQDLTQDDTLEPGKSYCINILQDTVWEIQPVKEITEFVYDGDGGRVKKTVGDTPGESSGHPGGVSSATTYIGSLYEVESSGSTRKHIFAGSQRICTIQTPNSEPPSANYYHSDHLGSSSVITDKDGNEIQRIEYLPFGKTAVSAGTDTVTHKYTGKELDAATGLYYYGARYYDAELGRFITADTIIQSSFDPQTFNRYTYVRNNPIKYIDPSGHFFGLIFAIIVAVAKAAAVGAIIGGAMAAITGGDIGKGMLTGAISGVIFAGVGALMTGFLAHTVAGAMSGAANAAINGGDIGRGAMIGGLSGLAFSSISQLGVSADGSSSWRWGLARVGLSAAAGGGISELAGGSFGEGAAFAGAISGADFLYRSIMDTNKQTRGKKGTMDTADSPGQPRLYDLNNPFKVDGSKNPNTVGNAASAGAKGLGHFFADETGPVMNFVGKNVSGFQGMSSFHDAITAGVRAAFGQTANKFLFNFQSMPPSYAINLMSAAMNDYPALVGQSELYGEGSN